ncbi:WEB family protein At5g55860-like isoform X1 [Dioscorea cayenensis subsp. rotundata]|uniref:WEB family protein At5g55860-like isoform X1 n=2 Tax=Dioscorea cayennensis subsp. rotundata TaxID=55577 RepID=A0AB40CKE5_DIOCR|nr:WEB family protein At5g55860-like isoform X1 [Dioscorea cayenensis subsp. rotundata]
MHGLKPPSKTWRIPPQFQGFQSSQNIHSVDSVGLLVKRSSMGMRIRQTATDSPKAEVGEIDTRAPFASVKAALSLFGAGASSPEKLTVRRPKPAPIENALAKETEFHLAQKELNKLKEQLSNSETTRAQALAELDVVKRTVEDIYQKLNAINESKQFALKATESAKSQTKQLEEASSGGISQQDAAWKQELNISREKYALVMTELDAAKQELRHIKKDHERYMNAKLCAFKEEAQAKDLDERNKERSAQLSKEINEAKESLLHVKLAIEQAQQEESKIISAKGTTWQSHHQALEETQRKLASQKKRFEPELYQNFEAKLAEVTTEIACVQKEIESTKTSGFDSVSTATTDLLVAKEVLQKTVEEENSLLKLIESLKIELEAVKEEHAELKKKDVETESVIGSLHLKLRRCKDDLEAAIASDSKTTLASDEMVSSLEKLSVELEIAQGETEAMNKNAQELRNEAEAACISLDTAEKRLKVALKDAEEAKAAELMALDQIKDLSEKTNAARASISESGTDITISAEEYSSLSRKVEESEKVAEMKVAAAIAQVEAVRTSENEVIKRLEAVKKEMERMETATTEALKRAEMAEAAKKAVEGELRRWREREHKRAAEPAPRIITETQTTTEASSATLKDIPILERTDENPQTNKAHVAKKTLLPSLSGIFHRKKSQVNG